jgi:hypothetical protein
LVGMNVSNGNLVFQTLVSQYPCCSMVSGIFRCPIGDAIPFRRFIEGET